MVKIFIFTLTCLPIFIQAQTLPELINEYQKECDKIVFDTIEQKGIIKYEYVPVLDDKGKISHYALGSPDTTWQSPNCPEFKHDAIAYYTGGSIIWRSTTSSFDNLNLNVSGPLYGTEKSKHHEVEISREYICECKLRKVTPFSQHFWDWLLNHK